HHLSKSDLTKRWGTGLGKQLGNEWLAIRLETPWFVDSVLLLAPNFSSDFPRGVRLSGLPSCTSSQELFERERVVLFEREPWRGSIYLTDDGLPYLTHESTVHITLEEATPLQCLLIEQIGRNENFDW